MKKVLDAIVGTIAVLTVFVETDQFEAGDTLVAFAIQITVLLVAVAYLRADKIVMMLRERKLRM